MVVFRGFVGTLGLVAGAASLLPSILAAQSDGQPIRFSSTRSCRGEERQRDSCPDLPVCNPCTPQNCVFRAWSDWTPGHGCSQLCYRHRDIASHANECGSPCEGPKIESKSCPKQDCINVPQNCTLSEWGAWSTCASPFDQKTRTREIASNPMHGGASCEGSLKETDSCGAEKPTACVFAEWGQWTICDVSCGGGHQAQMRRILTPNAHGGQPCLGTLRKTRMCNTEPCGVAVDCKVGEWGTWVGCDAKSPTQKYRARELLMPASNGGKQCDVSMQETVGCVISQPPEDCVISTWEAWRTCDVNCGGGQTYRKRSIVSQPKFGGRCDPGNLEETAQCNTQSCYNPENDCVLSVWSDWGACSLSCGRGEMSRSRNVQQIAKNGGIGCQGGLEEVVGCMVNDCGASDCVWNEWDPWGACTASCGGGTKRRHRTVAIQPHMDGKLCAPEDKLEIAACSTQPCTTCVDGAWSVWSDWSACSATCGAGFRHRHRDVSQQPNSCGSPVEGLEDDFEKCEMPTPCVEDKDCVLGDWNEWSDCSCACFGSRERSRSVAQYATGKGKPCALEALKITEACNPAVKEATPLECLSNDTRPCKLSEWADWSSCSATCDGGQQERSRSIVSPPAIGGLPCEGALRETQACGTISCNTQCINCEWSAWGDWSGCSRCVDQKYRRRSISRQPNSCGTPCAVEAAKETALCSGGCAKTRYCTWTDWSPIGTCPDHCGATSSLRQRTLQTLDSVPVGSTALIEGTGELQCSGMQLEQVACPLIPCNADEKPVNCEWGPWSQWSAPTFSQLCERKRTIYTVNANGGIPCSGALDETKVCATSAKPPEDCQYSEWHDWTTCQTPESQRYRERIVVKPGQNGGAVCAGVLHETGSCSTPPPAKVDCAVQPWGDWGSCSSTCSTGVTLRSRGILNRAANGGAGCGEVMQELKECDLGPCSGAPIACVLGEWGLWSSCSDDFQQLRRRKIATASANGGDACDGPLMEVRTCSNSVDCKVSDWTVWEDCDATCGGGQQMRQRQIVVNPTPDGQTCPEDLVQTQPCMTQSCAVTDCILGQWSSYSQCSSTCGPGQQRRTREIMRYAGPGGKGCSGHMEESVACSDRDCAVTDCVWNDWSPWSACSCSCGGGHRDRHRTIKVFAQKGGKPCDAEPMSEIDGCSMSPCNSTCVDGVWGDWEPWQKCSQTCDGGTTWRVRSVVREANDCGVPAVGMHREYASCSEDVPCIPKVDCVLSEWTEWAGCTMPCNGIKKRVRRVTKHARGGGMSCSDSLMEMSPCNPAPGEVSPPACPKEDTRDCVVGEWSNWGPCSASCGGGQYVRDRHILEPATLGGKMCPSTLKETEECNAQPCEAACDPEDCTWGSWSDWGACTKCSGEMMRFRSVAKHNSCGGKVCAAKDSEQVAKCPRQCHEPAYCAMGAWGAWSTCSATCGEGFRERSRSLALTAAPNEERFLDDFSSTQLSEGLDEERLEASLQSLSDRARELEGRRTRELLVSFACGLAALAAVLGLSRNRLSSSGAGGVYTRAMHIDGNE